MIAVAGRVCRTERLRCIFFDQQSRNIRILFVFLLLVTIFFLVLILVVLVFVFVLMLFLVLLLFLRLKINKTFRVWTTTNILANFRSITFDCPSAPFSLSLSLSFSFSVFGLPAAAASSSFLNIPGSKPMGPDVPGIMPGNDTELSEWWKSVFMRLTSGGRTGSSSLSTLISTGSGVGSGTSVFGTIIGSSTTTSSSILMSGVGIRIGSSSSIFIIGLADRRSIVAESFGIFGIFGICDRLDDSEPTTAVGRFEPYSA